MAKKKMIRPARLVVVRHAESMRNKAKKGKVYFADEEARRIIKGVPDHEIPLTDLGHTQSVMTGEALRELFPPFDYVYHSGYLRTVQTANGIMSAYPREAQKEMRVRMNLFIRERDPGYTYDMTREEAEAAFPWLEEIWQTFGGFFARPVGGESLAQVTERVYLFLNMLFRDRAGMNILVVTHGGTKRCIRFLLEHWGYDRGTSWPPGESPKNCGVTVYEYDEATKRLVLQDYNKVYWPESLLKN